MGACMKREFKLRLTPAQAYHLRNLISLHADCRQTGWAELKRALDANYVAMARNEMTYGAMPARELKQFNSVSADHED